MTEMNYIENTTIDQQKYKELIQSGEWKTNFRNCRFENVRFNSVDFTNAVFDNCAFLRCVFVYCDLSTAKFIEPEFEDGYSGFLHCFFYEKDNQGIQFVGEIKGSENARDLYIYQEKVGDAMYTFWCDSWDHDLYLDDWKVCVSGNSPYDKYKSILIENIPLEDKDFRRKAFEILQKEYPNISFFEEENRNYYYASRLP